MTTLPRERTDRRNLLLTRGLLLLGVFWLLTSVYSVGVDEQAVVRRFGAVIAERTPPGLHLGLPWPIDRVDRVKVREQKRLNVGFEFPDQLLGRPVAPTQREFLTGDQNLINIELLVQYTVRDPRRYLFSTTNVTETLRAAAEASIARTVAGHPVDMLLTVGKLEVQTQLQNTLQQTADRCELGVAISSVNIQSVTPPLRVADAFRDVAGAREDRDRLVKEAESYANATIPAAEGEAARQHEEALGYRDQKIDQAQGDAERFLQAYAAYRLSPDVTRTRLYLEAMEEILPRLKIVHLDSQGGRSPIDLNLLPRASTPKGGESDGSASPPAATGP